MTLYQELVKNLPSYKENLDLINFLKHKDDISKILEDGYSMRQIWLYLIEKKYIAISYFTFTKYVKKHCYFKNKQINNIDYVNINYNKNKKENINEKSKEILNRTKKTFHYDPNDALDQDYINKLIG